MENEKKNGRKENAADDYTCRLEKKCYVSESDVMHHVIVSWLRIESRAPYSSISYLAVCVPCMQREQSKRNGEKKSQRLGSVSLSFSLCSSHSSHRSLLDLISMNLERSAF